MTSRLADLHAAGQAVWLDFVDRDFLASGGLTRLIETDGLTGVTSNPAIFEKTMGQGASYQVAFATALASGDRSVAELYEHEAIVDIQVAADMLRPVYDRLDAMDGYVSLEVSPYLADDTEATIAEARRIWAAVDRPNLMVKVPGTAAGFPAIRQLIEDGININVTLLFSVSAYAAVAEAYRAGLTARLARGLAIDRIASVASFFVSRIDSAIDHEIDARVAAGDARAERLKALRGKLAIANAKAAHGRFLGQVGTLDWQHLAAHGAMPQRLLWASTGTKNPAFPDTLYVDALIAPDTVNTMPPKTMDAFRDHGAIGAGLAGYGDAAREILAEAEALGLDLAAVTDRLLAEGLTQFRDAFDRLLSQVAERRLELLGQDVNSMTVRLPAALAEAVDARLAAAAREGWSRRLWSGDAALWTGADEANWLGWLPAAHGDQVDLIALAQLGHEARSFDHAVLIGMGGSSLGPEVLALILGSASGSPRLHVLDSTDPKQIGRVASAIDPARTLFIVSSKSGSTMEPELLRAYFYEASGGKADHFVAVTDPGSKLEHQARADGFHAIFAGDPAIGGRYSVLSAFGMVPAAVIGVDVATLFARTRPMLLACGPDVPPTANPGIHLGAILGEAAARGRDKLTIIPSAGLEPFGAWLEQLIAESTGKDGKGIIPVDLEPLGAVADYGADRVFVHLHLEGDSDFGIETRLAALAEAGHPVVAIRVADRLQLAQEFLRWEIATATVGAVLGINPFNQPDVEDAKVATRRLVDAYERTGSLEPATALYEDDDVAVYGPSGRGPAGGNAATLLADLFAGLDSGGYCGLLAYVERNPTHTEAIARMRTAIRGEKRVATVAGFGPRFLHSTGQAYKGGPAVGTFVEITRDSAEDLAIPGNRATFGTVQLAQARGDLDVLASRGQRVLRIHLKTGRIETLEALVAAALTL